MYRNGPENLTVSEAHFGMFKYADFALGTAYELNPSHYAYSTITHQLANKIYTKNLRQMLRLNNNSYAYPFEDIIVAWATE